MEISPIKLSFGSNYIIPYSCAKNSVEMKNCLRYLKRYTDQEGFIESSQGVLFNNNYNINETSRMLKNIFELFKIRIQKLNESNYFSVTQLNESYEYMAKKLYNKKESTKLIKHYNNLGEDKYIEYARLKSQFEDSKYSVLG